MAVQRGCASNPGNGHRCRTLPECGFLAEFTTLLEYGRMMRADIETETTSRSTGRPAIFGRTLKGDIIFVVYELYEDDDGREFVYVHTAYLAEDE